MASLFSKTKPRSSQRSLRFLFSAFLAFCAVSSSLVAAAQTSDRARTEALARTLDELKKTRQALEARRAELAVLRGSDEKAHAAAQRAEQVKSELIRDIDRKRDLNAQLAGELQAAQQKLQAALRDLASGA